MAAGHRPGAPCRHQRERSPACSVAQISFHLNRAMDHGLTREEASEVLTHLAFYAGWRNAISAVRSSRKSSTSGAGALPAR
jgi:alkylhydroperoxidase/carboxymuconolactone decarboxylase family protein YurZ